MVEQAGGTIMLGLGLGLGLGAGLSGGAVAPPAYQFGNAGYRTTGSTAMVSPSGTQLSEISDTYLCPQPAGTRIVFTNFSLASGALPPGSARELMPGNTNMLDFVVGFTGAAGTGTKFTFMFGGNNSVVMPDGGFAITDPIADAWPGGWIRTSISTPSAGKRPGGFPIATMLGEDRRISTAVQSSLANGGAIAGGASLPTNSGFYPSAVLVPGTASPSVFLIGDSITQQDDQIIFITPRGMLGAFARGLDDPSGGRVGVGNFGHHGAAMLDFMDITPGSLKFSQRYALLDYIRTTLNGGRWPFSHIWSQGLRNDFSGMTVTDPTDALAQFNARADGWWAWLASTFPDAPIIQSTVSCRVTADATTGYTTLTGQVPRTLNMGPALIAFNDRIITEPAPIALGVDLRPAIEELKAEGPVWTRTAFTLAGGGTLVNAMASGASLVSVLVASATAPVPGTYLVFEPGGANFEIRAVIQAVVNNGDGTFTLTCSGTTGKAHAAGAAVMSANTSDGTHPSSVLHQAMAPLVTASKGAFPA